MNKTKGIILIAQETERFISSINWAMVTKMNTINKIRRAGLAGLIGAGSLFSVGCETTPQANALGQGLILQALYTAVDSGIKGSLDPSASNVNVNVYNQVPQAQEQKSIDFFICQSWRDEDNNGIRDYHEIRGIKDNFASGEIFTIGFIIKGYKGSVENINIIDANQRRVYENSDPILGDSMVGAIGIKCTSGGYIVECRIDNQLVKSQELLITE